MDDPQNEKETQVQNNNDKAEFASVVPEITWLAVKVSLAFYVGSISNFYSSLILTIKFLIDLGLINYTRGFVIKETHSFLAFPIKIVVVPISFKNKGVEVRPENVNTRIKNSKQ